MKRWLIRLAVLLVVLVVGLVIAGVVVSEDPPVGKAGPFADLLARKMMKAVEISKWKKTGAIEWNFADRFQHLWDKDRGYSRVIWEEYEVVFDIATKRGVVKKNGETIEGDEAKTAINEAYKRWVNDAFWLNPHGKFFDDGVTRELVDLGGGKSALLVRFGNGGVTPGDTYLFYPGGDFKPEKWKMWISILPIGGLEVTWDRYVLLQTGAYVSTKHKGLLSFEIKDVRGATNITGLYSEDPFSALGPSDVASTRPADARFAVPTPQPTSAPAP